MVLPGAQPRQAHLEGHAEHDAGVDAWLDGFLDYWLGLDAAADECEDRRADAVSLVDAADCAPPRCPGAKDGAAIERA